MADADHASFDANLGILSDEDLEALPGDWGTFIRVVMFSNGPVLYVYDKRADDRAPRYIIPFYADTWEDIRGLVPGEIYNKAGLTLAEATVQARAALGKKR